MMHPGAMLCQSPSPMGLPLLGFNLVMPHQRFWEVDFESPQIKRDQMRKVIKEDQSRAHETNKRRISGNWEESREWVWLEEDAESEKQERKEG